mmetsp:Transcript_8032/g.12297  ORF Transcript_8032/g.12297 Transcript_8032/m.12297 type:complete len:580 (+) Transcript_8032:134-1873(+)|eukprot:CAMPEP_0178912252 /NCGR_PEP_ID=MMETSP0786-20121207/10155_1 /TAXON_ID=186022 /ORGANISM="Thalassionema frauenfeldii, Strain CCMP 1798" /LENGTH=579 /DNA_ID=CAMNT_0020584805 /DNA_START=117 /DNA_END=1856 /DNA_ORIENTATION=+
MNDNDVPTLVSIRCASQYEVIGTIATRKNEESQPLLRPISPVTQITNSLSESQHTMQNKLLDQQLTIELINKEIKVELRPKSKSPVPNRRNYSRNSSNASTTALKSGNNAEYCHNKHSSKRTIHSRETKSRRHDRRRDSPDIMRKEEKSELDNSNSTTNSKHKPNRGRAASFSRVLEKPQKELFDISNRGRDGKTIPSQDQSLKMLRYQAMAKIEKNLSSRSGRSFSSRVHKRSSSSQSQPEEIKKTSMSSNARNTVLLSRKLEELGRHSNSSDKSLISQNHDRETNQNASFEDSQSSRGIALLAEKSMKLSDICVGVSSSHSSPTVLDGSRSSLKLEDCRKTRSFSGERLDNGELLSNHNIRRVVRPRRTEMINGFPSISNGPRKDLMFVNDYRGINHSSTPSLHGSKKDLMFTGHAGISPLAHQLMEAGRERKTRRTLSGSLYPPPLGPIRSFNGNASTSNERWENSYHSFDYTQDERISCDEQYESRKSHLIKDAIQPCTKTLNQERAKDCFEDFNHLLKVNANPWDKLASCEVESFNSSPEFNELLKIHSKQTKKIKKSRNLRGLSLRKLVPKSA